MVEVARALLPNPRSCCWTRWGGAYPLVVIRVCDVLVRDHEEWMTTLPITEQNIPRGKFRDPFRADGPGSP